MNPLFAALQIPQLQPLPQQPMPMLGQSRLQIPIQGRRTTQQPQQPQESTTFNYYEDNSSPPAPQSMAQPDASKYFQNPRKDIQGPRMDAPGQPPGGNNGWFPQPPGNQPWGPMNPPAMPMPNERDLMQQPNFAQNPLLDALAMVPPQMMFMPMQQQPEEEAGGEGEGDD